MINIDSRDTNKIEIRGSVAQVSAEIAFALDCLIDKMQQEKLVSDRLSAITYLHLLVDHLNRRQEENEQN